MATRQEIAQKIASEPSAYKVCEGCSSIVVRATDLCPNCHAYRFNDREEDVISQAKLLGSRPATSVTLSDLQ